MGAMRSISRVSMPSGMSGSALPGVERLDQTVSPALTSPRSSSRTMKQLAATIEERMPEPWGPVVRTSQPLAGIREDAALELAPARLLPHRLDRAARKRGPIELPAARQLPERRADEEVEGEHRGDRIARQPEELRAADAADGQRPPRLHRHLPEVDPADLAAAPP